MKITLCFSILLFTLGGCATQTVPAIDHRHPASPLAAEASSPPLPRMLGSDDMSSRTRQLIAARAANVNEPAQDSSRGDSIPAAPVEGSKPANSKKPTGHEHH